jgi:hypothetical protein
VDAFQGVTCGAAMMEVVGVGKVIGVGKSADVGKVEVPRSFGWKR